MTTTPPATSAADVLPAIDELLARPYPPAPTASGEGGPTWWVDSRFLSGDFWDDEDNNALHEADARAQELLDALTEALTARWGSPATVDLWSYLTADYENPRSEPYEPYEPIDRLSQLATELLVWPLDGGTRWLGLTVGQGDRELPLELLTAVAEGPPPAPTAPAHH
ncbi:hypothetical protein ACIRD3_11275 [Kitasatospora sp. NPDC093550]|uniref:hypothetical protein n=1 Tax=Kitasatospora sp. NPDC093550 TaxID=3364089 RepID=UPI00381EA9F9